MPSFNLLNLVPKTVAAAAVVLLFVASLAATFIAGRVDKNEVVLSACQDGAWACSPSGSAAGTIDGGGMYRCVGGSYQQQTACGAGAKCCAIDNQVKCILMSATCGAAAEPDASDISSVDTKTCCKCDTGAMCLGQNNTYRKCVGGCYKELSCGTGKSLCNQITQLCPAPQTKCTEPGSVVSSKKADGASYLEICATDYTSNEIQCSLTLKQKEAAACYEAQTNGLSIAATSIESDDGFTITSQRIQTGVDANFKPIYSGTKFVINDFNGMTDCQSLDEPLQSREITTKNIREKLGCAASQSSDTSSSLCQSLELACCLTGDHCQSKGCDENIVYDSYYGCTKINFGKQLVVKKSDGSDCGVCALQTFGCGESLTQKDSNGVYAYKKCEPNTDTAAGAPKGCWGASLACAKGNADGCDQICANASETKTWSKNALANAKTDGNQSKTAPVSVKCGNVTCQRGQTCLNGKCVDKSFTLDASKLNGKLTANQAAQEICRQIYDGQPTSDLEVLANRLADCQNLVKPYIDKDGIFDLKSLSDINKQLAANPHIQEVGQFSVLPGEVDTQKDKDLAAVTFTPYTWSVSQNRWVADEKLAGGNKLKIITNNEAPSSYPRNKANETTTKITKFLTEFYANNKRPVYNAQYWTCVDYAVRMVNAAQAQGIPAYFARGSYNKEEGHAFVAFDTSGTVLALGGTDPAGYSGSGTYAPQEFILFEPQQITLNKPEIPVNFSKLLNVDIYKTFDYTLSDENPQYPNKSQATGHEVDAIRFVPSGENPNAPQTKSMDYSDPRISIDPSKTAGNVTAKQQYLTYSTQSLSDTGETQSSLTLDISKFGSKMTAKDATTEIYNQLYPLTPVTSLELMSQRMATIQSLIKPYVNSDGTFDLNKFALSANNADLGAAFTLTSGQ